MQANNLQTSELNISIVSSRVKIMRNMEKYPFVNSLSIEKKKKMEEEIINFIKEIDKNAAVYEIGKLSNNEKKIFLDDNIVDEKFLSQNNGKFIKFNKNDASILLNYNEHINIFIIQPKLGLEEAYIAAEKIESKLGKQFPYIASTKYGFLTSYIKNCGLAAKISVLVHLPGITFLKKNDEIFKMFYERGYNIKPWEYNGLKTSNYFIISSRLNFGVSEEQLIQRFTLGIQNLIELDKNSLYEYFQKNKDELVDIIYRSYGILKYAVKMEYEEALNFISYLRLGLEINLDLQVSVDVLNELFNGIKNGHVLAMSLKHNIAENIARANIIKALLN